jgi:hypothetical protein
MDWGTVLALLGVVIGVFLRAYYPWLKAKAEAEQAGEAVSFKPKYMVTALVSLLVTGLSALYAISAFTMPEVTDYDGLAFLLTFGISYGYAFTSVLNLPLEASDAKAVKAP